MTAIHTFYESHLHMGNVGSDKRFSRFNIPIGTQYRSFRQLAKKLVALLISNVLDKCQTLLVHQVILDQDL